MRVIVFGALLLGCATFGAGTFAFHHSHRPSASARVVVDLADEFGDGTPEFLRLRNPSDRQSFRASFAQLLEVEARKQAQGLLDPEITDCAALLRFAYRESLRAHSANWAHDLDLAPGQIPPAVTAYRFPNTPAGTGLFRTHSGVFRPQDLTDGTFAEFADADALRRFNTHLIAREVDAASSADLLFFRQLEQRSPFHSMAVVREKGETVVIYHTGPDRKRLGEIRRVLLSELLRHPDARWRPVPENPNFLGVYRWNILREN